MITPNATRQQSPREQEPRGAGSAKGRLKVGKLEELEVLEFGRQHGCVVNTD